MPKLDIPAPPLFSALSDQSSSAKSIFSGSRFFGFLDKQIQSQVDSVALKPKQLKKLQPKLQKLSEAYESGDYERALSIASNVRKALGPYYLDQKPSGWLLLCEGATHLEIDNKSSAYDCFNNAFRALEKPDERLLRLGIARASTDDQDQASKLIGGFIQDPEWFMNNATEDEFHHVKAAISLAEEYLRQIEDDAETVLRAALADRLDQEKRAFTLSEAAAKHRERPHILSEEDEKARIQIDKEYRDLLLKWFTVPRHPNMGSYGSHPKEDLENLISFQLIAESKDEARFEAVFKVFSGESKYRYHLRRSTLPNSDQQLWRIHEIWSIWDEEDIQLY